MSTAMRDLTEEDVANLIGFRARVEDPGKLTEQLRSADATLGEADIIVAAFDIPDTTNPYGLPNPQVIDRGAFDGFLRTIGEEGSRPFLLDHGDVHIRGFVDSTKIIGKAMKFAARSDGFAFRGIYNLKKTTGRDAFSDLEFDQATGGGDTVRFSFRSPAEEDAYQGSDGFEHVRSFTDVKEVSQLAFGAQMRTGVIPGTIVMRTAVPAHSTPTVDSAWDAAAQVAKIPGDASTADLRKMFAWVPSGDSFSKTDCKGPHHVWSNGAGAAVVAACQAIINALNGARGGFDIPAGDRQGVYGHAARHLRDSGVKDVAPLRTEAPVSVTGDDLRTMFAEDQDFAGLAVQIAAEAGVDVARHAYHGDNLPPPPTLTLVREWLKDPGWREKMEQELRGDEPMRNLIKELVSRSEAEDPVSEWWRQRLATA